MEIPILIVSVVEECKKTADVFEIVFVPWHFG